MAKRKMSAEQRQAAIERLAKAREKRLKENKIFQDFSLQNNLLKNLGKRFKSKRTLFACRFANK